MKNIITLRKEKEEYILYSPKMRAYIKLKEEIIDEIFKIMKNESNRKDIINTLDRENQEIMHDIGLDCFSEIEYFDFSKNDIQIPLEVYFDYTTVCNMRCQHCYNRENLNQYTMQEDMIKKIFADMKALGIRRVHLAGGEPLIFEDLLKVYIDAAYDNGIVTSIATNGVLLTKEISEYLCSKEVVSVSISLDGYDKKSYEEIRGDGNWEKAVKGIENILHARNKLKTNMEICIKPTYTPNDEEIFFESAIVTAINLGVDKIKFANPERCIYHEVGYYGRIKDAYYEKAKLIEKLKAKYGRKIAITLINNPVMNNASIGLRGRHGCIGAQELIAINPNGDITPCLMNRKVLGNVYDVKSLKEFFENSQTLRDYIKIIDYAPCHKCEMYEQCRGGCQVRKYVEYGEIVNVDPLCPLDRIKNFEKF